MQKSHPQHATQQIRPAALRDDYGAAALHGVRGAQLSAAIHNSPRQTAQRRIIDVVRNSPAMAAQRRLLDSVNDGKSPAKNNAPIQRYTTAGGYKISTNTHYAVAEDAGNTLYVLHDPQVQNGNAPAPQPAALVQAGADTSVIGGRTYMQYSYTQEFTNDCLGFAENIARGTDQDSDRAELRARENRPVGGDRLFGQSDEQNTQIANSPNFNQGQGANPAIGEAYTTVRSVDPVAGETPYHAAAVVAKDAPDNVTIEADASDADRDEPVFDMYDTTPENVDRPDGSITFHEAYSGTYTSADGDNVTARRLSHRFAHDSAR
jgi:hypothetical protein